MRWPPRGSARSTISASSLVRAMGREAMMARATLRARFSSP